MDKNIHKMSSHCTCDGPCTHGFKVVKVVGPPGPTGPTGGISLPDFPVIPPKCRVVSDVVNISSLQSTNNCIFTQATPYAIFDDECELGTGNKIVNLSLSAELTQMFPSATGLPGNSCCSGTFSIDLSNYLTTLDMRIVFSYSAVCTMFADDCNVLMNSMLRGGANPTSLGGCINAYNHDSSAVSDVTVQFSAKITLQLEPNP